MVVVIVISMQLMVSGSAASLKAYGQSNGYAEQCLSAIKVVTAFGMEKTEIRNYLEHLERGRIAGAKEKVAIAMGMALMMFMVYASYSYSFWVGAKFVSNEVINSTTGEVYKFSEVIGIFFGILIALFGFGTAGPAF
jgi:ATP-binding cassette subfamily B (MDR/TAP) protein 1